MQKSALNPRLGAMSVHKGHRIFHHKGVLVCVKCGELQHVSEPQAASLLSWESFEAGKGGPQENGESRNTAAWSRVAPLRRRGAANPDGCDESCQTRVTSCHARSRMALWVVGLGRGFGGGERALPSGVAKVFPERRLRFML